MKVNDLRIGNYIFNPNTKEVKQVDIDTLIEIDKGAVYYGIYISDKWLDKLGFWHDISNKEYGLDDVRLYIDTDAYGLPQYVNEWVFEYGLNDIVNIKYVHQLQNLFYAICGYELVK